MIVDPSKTFGHFLRYVLLRLGYNAAHVESADEGLKVIDRSRPSLVTCEAHMKEMDGMEFCERVREKKYSPEIPVVMVSVDGTPETKLLARKAGCAEYLTKPVTFRTIHDLTERHLSFSHQRRHLRARMSLKVMVDDGSGEREMRSATMSEGGIYLCTDHPAKEGSKLGIKLLLPGLKSQISLRGEVVYCVKDDNEDISAGMGVKFVGADENLIALLRNYVESYLADFLPEPPDG